MATEEKTTTNSLQPLAGAKESRNFKPIVPHDFTPPDMVQSNTGKKISSAWIGVVALLFFGILLLLYLRFSTAVLITTTPENADIELSGFTPRIANSYLLLSGSYKVTARAKGYHDNQLDFAVEGADSQTLNIELIPLPGHIDVTSNVAELVVVIDGQINGTKLPGVLRDIPKGDYQFEFSSHRYFPQAVDVTVQGFDQLQTLNVNMLPAWGNLQLTSVPEGADITIDGQLIGKTPLQVEVLETGSDVSVTKPGFNPWSDTVTAKAGESSVFPLITLEPADGVVTVNSDPEGASLTIDGVFVGQTPYNTQLSSLKTHQLKLFSKGYQVFNKEVLLKPEERRSINWTLKPELGKVQFRLSPNNAQIFVNNKLRGTGNQILSLLAVEQTIEVKLDGYVSQRLVIAPRTGLTQSVSVSLLTEQQNYWAQFPDTVVAPAGIKTKLMRPDSIFTMGTPRRESGRRSNEAERNVHINKPFYIAQFETTNAQFQQFQREHNSLQIAAMSLNNANQPVVNVSWLAAARFCNWLSKEAQLTPVYAIAKDRLLESDMTANGYRLPTEVEWSWIARVEEKSKNRRFIWGDNYPPADTVANYADKSAQTILGKSVPRYNDGFVLTAPVGSFPADAKGLFDFAGNVSEWVHDFYSTSPNKGKPELNPSGPQAGRDHVLRGASWRHGSRTEIRLSYRNFGSEAELDIGFRVARNIE